MVLSKIFCELDHPTVDDLKELGALRNDSKQKSETPEEDENPECEDQKPSDKYWQNLIKRQYENDPFSLNPVLASSVTKFFTAHSKVDYALEPNHLMEILAEYYASRSEGKDEYLYYQGVQECIASFNDLSLTLMKNYPSNPSRYMNLLKELDETLAMMKIDASLVPPEAVPATDNNITDDDLDDVPF